jgi:hypothetical protein
VNASPDREPSAADQSIAIRALARQQREALHAQIQAARLQQLVATRLVQGAPQLPREAPSRPARSRPEWHDAVANARCESDLMAALDRFRRQWDPVILQALPPDCRQCAAASADQVAELAVAFTAAELRFEGSPEMHALLLELSRLFIAAAERLRHIRDPGAGAAILRKR